MTSVTTIGLDIAKNIFQVYAGGISRTVCPSADLARPEILKPYVSAGRPTPPTNEAASGPALSFPAARREYKLLAEMRGFGQPKSLNYR